MPVCIEPELNFTQVMERNDTSGTSVKENEQNQLREGLKPRKIGLCDYDPKLNPNTKSDDDDDDDDTRVSTSSIVRQIEEREAIYDLLDEEEDDETKPETSSDCASMHSSLEQKKCKQSVTHKQTSSTEAETSHIGPCMSPVSQECSVTPLHMEAKFSPTPCSLGDASPSQPESPPCEQTEDYFSQNLSESPVINAHCDLEASSAICKQRVANVNHLQEQNSFQEHHATQETKSKSQGLQPPPTPFPSFSPLLRMPTNPPQSSCSPPFMSVVPSSHKQPSFGSGNPQSSFSSTISLRSCGMQEQKNKLYPRLDPISRPHPPLNQGSCFSFLNEGTCRRPVCHWIHQVK